MREMHATREPRRGHPCNIPLFFKFCCPFSNLLTDFSRVTPTVLKCLLYGIHQISYLLGIRGEKGRFLKVASHLLLLHLDTEFFIRNEDATWPVPKGPSAFPKRPPFNRGKGKAFPLQAWTGSEGSRKLRLPDFITTAQDGGRLSALLTGRHYPQEILVVLISVRG